MQSRLLFALVMGALALGPLWSGCATQQDTDRRSSDAMSGATPGQAGVGATGAAASGGSGGAAGNAGSSATGGKAGSAGGGGATSAGSGSATGGEPSEPAGGAAGEDGAGGGGGAPSECDAGCDDGDPCTTDACLLGHCSHTASTAPCADDNDPCTEDVCQGGSCKHPDNGTCECKTAADCDDNEECTSDSCSANHECVNANRNGACTDDGSPCTTEACSAGQCVSTDNQTCECMTATDCDDQDPCTFNQCNASHDCAYPDNGSCPVGTPFVVNNFNSNADWVANITTPGGRPLVKTGFTNTNLEGVTNVYLAATAAATLEMDVASMVGLGKLRIAIRCVQAGSEAMVHVGVWNGTAWSEKVLGGYGAVPVADYGSLDVPLVDFGVPLNQITKVRLRFAPTGGIKEWRLNEIAALD